MAELTLTLRGLPTHTAAALRSMLVLLDSALGARWRLMDAPIADVILVPGERMMFPYAGRRAPRVRRKWGSSGLHPCHPE